MLLLPSSSYKNYTKMIKLFIIASVAHKCRRKIKNQKKRGMGGPLGVGEGGQASMQRNAIERKMYNFFTIRWFLRIEHNSKFSNYNKIYTNFKTVEQCYRSFYHLFSVLLSR
jgi:hypothetical protein